MAVHGAGELDRATWHHGRMETTIRWAFQVLETNARKAGRRVWSLWSFEDAQRTRNVPSPRRHVYTSHMDREKRVFT